MGPTMPAPFNNQITYLVPKSGLQLYATLGFLFWRSPLPNAHSLAQRGEQGYTKVPFYNLLNSGGQILLIRSAAAPAVGCHGGNQENRVQPGLAGKQNVCAKWPCSTPRAGHVTSQHPALSSLCSHTVWNCKAREVGLCSSHAHYKLLLLLLPLYKPLTLGPL